MIVLQKEQQFAKYQVWFKFEECGKKFVRIDGFENVSVARGYARILKAQGDGFVELSVLKGGQNLALKF